MGSVNKVTLIGNLGKDPESRSMQSGGKVVSFSLATSESWQDKASGQRREKTQWHRIAIFNEKIGEIAEKYLKKGSTVYIEGALETRKYTDSAGVERETCEIVLARFRGDLVLLNGRGDAAGGSAGAARAAPAASRSPSWEPPSGDMDDDEIPF
jgi:single-strand DNA-binding protein